MPSLGSLAYSILPNGKNLIQSCRMLVGFICKLFFKNYFTQRKIYLSFSQFWVNIFLNIKSHRTLLNSSFLEPKNSKFLCKAAECWKVSSNAAKRCATDRVTQFAFVFNYRQTQDDLSSLAEALDGDYLRFFLVNLLRGSRGAAWCHLNWNFPLNIANATRHLKKESSMASNTKVLSDYEFIVSSRQQIPLLKSRRRRKRDLNFSNASCRKRCAVAIFFYNWMIHT